MQASTIVRRYPSMRIASIRLPWSLPHPSGGRAGDKLELIDEERGSQYLWSWVNEDAVAKAFLLALEESSVWSGHEVFFVAAPETTVPADSLILRDKYFPKVPVREGKLLGNTGFFDCSKAERLLRWKHSIS